MTFFAEWGSLLASSLAVPVWVWVICWHLKARARFRQDELVAQSVIIDAEARTGELTAELAKVRAMEAEWDALLEKTAKGSAADISPAELASFRGWLLETRDPRLVQAAKWIGQYLQHVANEARALAAGRMRVS